MSGFGTLVVIPIGMDADGIEVIKRAGLEQGFDKFPRETGTAGGDDGAIGISGAKGLAGGEGERGVLLGVGVGFPEIAVGFIPDFPQDAMAMEMSGGRSGETGEGGDAFRVLRGRAVFFVQRMGIIQNVDRAEAALFEIGSEGIVGGPIVLAGLMFDAFPKEIHADETEAGGGDEVQIFLAALSEVNVHADAGREDGGREIGGEQGERKQAKTEQE